MDRDKINHKAEATTAITRALGRLKDPDALGPLGQREIAAALEYAREQVDLIQEVKRSRKAPAAA